MLTLTVNLKPLVGNYAGCQATFHHHLPCSDSVVIYIKVWPTQAEAIPHQPHKTWGEVQTNETYLMVAHVPVGPFSKCHDFPHDDAEAPHVAGWSELPERDGLGSGPADGDFTSLTEETN